MTKTIASDKTLWVWRDGVWWFANKAPKWVLDCWEADGPASYLEEDELRLIVGDITLPQSRAVYLRLHVAALVKGTMTACDEEDAK